MPEPSRTSATAPEDHKLRGVARSLVIGVGGTGHKVLLDIRERLLAKHGSLERLPIVSFLLLDTDQAIFSKVPGITEAANLDNADKIHISVHGVESLRRTLPEYPHLRDWLDPRTLSGDIHQGAGAVRARGRLAYFWNYPTIARRIEELRIDGLLVIGGWSGYDAAMTLFRERSDYPAFSIPIVCLPASINNNLPGTEQSVGADTALNSIVDAVGKIKQSAVASKRCFVVEVMGRYCGYLAFMGMLATGAERVYLHEEGITLQDLQRDLDLLIEGFSSGKRLGVMIRNEYANPIYNTTFISSLFEEEGKDLFEVRWSVLGHLQQGGDPTPFDRVLATRYAVRCIEYLEDAATRGTPAASCIGQQKGHFQFTDFEDIGRTYDSPLQRPKEQWWMALRPLGRILAQPEPHFYETHSNPAQP